VKWSLALKSKAFDRTAVDVELSLLMVGLIIHYSNIIKIAKIIIINLHLIPDNVSSKKNRDDTQELIKTNNVSSKKKIEMIV